ncbi:MAG: xanthine dehydrogenase family protein subunit M [Dehalococcoidia bacterium]
MRRFDYVSARSIEETVAALGQDGDIRPLAGGTDLLTMMKADITAPSILIDIKRVPDLSGIRFVQGEGLTLGGLTTLAEIETNDVIRRRYPMLAEAASLAATPQLRNMATLGGNLLQRPRCWYFRSSHFHCWLKGGDQCQAREGENQFHALFGDRPCCAVHPSDLALVLVALDAEILLRGNEGERTLPIGEFFQLPDDDRRTETIARPDELITAVRIPPMPDNACGVYLKAMDRKVWAFALASVAAILTLDGTRIADARLVLGGVAPIPWRATAVESSLRGANADSATIDRAARTALADAESLQHNAYKIPLTTSLVRRALTACVGR